MYTSVIGKKFLEIYNKGKKKKATAKELFQTEVFKYFYNDEKYFKWVVNSPFVQQLSKEERKTVKTIHEEQQLKLAKLYDKIKNDPPDSSFAIGFPSATETFDTSGQVTTMNLPLDEENIFLSWIGAGFGLEIEGKQVLYIDRNEIIETLFEGWPEYRKHLNSKVLDMKPNEIDLWNSAWLDFNFNKNRIAKKFLLDEYIEKSSGEKNKDSYSIKQPSWIKMMFLLASIYPKENLTVFSSRYIYDKQKFMTLGFVNLNLTEVNKFSEFYSKIFAKVDGLSISNVINMYTTEYSFSRACEQGAIGLKAIEPKDLKKYMPGSKEFPKLKDDEKSKINYSIYITWVMAMLNNKELLDLAEKAANAFREFEKGGKKGLVKRDNQIKELLESRNRKDLIQQLAAIVEEDKQMSETCNDLVNSIMTDISADSIPLFVTLLRFKYALPNGNKQ